MFILTNTETSKQTNKLFLLLFFFIKKKNHKKFAQVDSGLNLKDSKVPLPNLQLETNRQMSQTDAQVSIPARKEAVGIIKILHS